LKNFSSNIIPKEKTKMTKREALVVSAYTGFLCGVTFADLHEYIEEVLEHPVFTHELASSSMIQLIKEKSRDEFIAIKVND